MKAIGVTFLFLLPTAIPSHSQEIIHLDQRREIFVDSFLIDQMKGLSLELHHPIDQGIVLAFDQPWEGPFSAYCTIIRDESKFRMYYRGLPEATRSEHQEVTCYAESNDGVRWTKPQLGLYHYAGTRQNNIILAQAGSVTHNFCPFLDTNPNVSDTARFKAIGGDRKSGLFAYVSTNGIHWKKLRDTAIYRDGIFDSQNVVFWSAYEQKYLCYYRTWTGEGFSGYRSVGRTTSDNFLNWDPGHQMTFGPKPEEHLYTQQTSPYFRAPHIYLAIGARFFPGRQVLTDDQAQSIGVDPKYYQDCSDAILMSSRGGLTYDRTFMESFIRPGIGAGHWVSRSNYPVLNVVQTTPNEMSIYVNENYAQPSAHIRRYSLRIDGFSSLHADFSGGQLLTKPFTFRGNHLEINFATSAAGYLKFALEQADGTPIPEFTMEEAYEIIGNEISYTVPWKNESGIHNWKGKPVRLKIKMKDADLYSIRFTDLPMNEK